MSLKDKMKNVFGVSEEYEEDYAETQDEIEVKGNARPTFFTGGKDKKNRLFMFREIFEYDEVQELSEALRNGVLVQLNLQRCEDSVATRIIDFLSGSIFILDGTIRRTGDKIFICAPNGIEIDGTYDKDADKRYIRNNTRENNRPNTKDDYLL